MEFSLLLWVKPDDEFLYILKEKPKAPDLLLKPLTVTTTTTTTSKTYRRRIGW